MHKKLCLLTILFSTFSAHAVCEEVPEEMVYFSDAAPVMIFPIYCGHMTLNDQKTTIKGYVVDLSVDVGNKAVVALRMQKGDEPCIYQAFKLDINDQSRQAYAKAQEIFETIDRSYAKHYADIPNLTCRKASIELIYPGIAEPLCLANRAPVFDIFIDTVRADIQREQSEFASLFVPPFRGEMGISYWADANHMPTL